MNEGRGPRRHDLRPITSGRELAASALSRVWGDSAFAASVLDSLLARAPDLDPRERGLATELTYGVLRTWKALDRRIEAFAPRGLPNDDWTRLQLRLAAYQILLLDRVPDFSSVNAAVGAVRAKRGPKLAGFCNALLRRLATAGERLELADAVRTTAPEWLFRRLTAAVGEAEACALLGASGHGAGSGLALRCIEGRSVPEWIAALPVGTHSSRTRRLDLRGDPRGREGWASGSFVLQEEGAQLVGLALGARPGEQVLDACCGRGQKTSLLMEQVGAQGMVWATDKFPAKLRELKQEFERLHLPMPQTAAVDWTMGSGSVPEGFDRILVDAPCTGSGTLRRRPEIALRLQEADPARMSAMAVAITRSAALRVRPGGIVVFAVCSVLPEEGEGVVAQLTDLLEPTPLDAPEWARLAQGASFARLLPLAHGTDGYFVASLRRR
jgi:16S rRNA (cytosine967-C5)-methyltransferase